MPQPREVHLVFTFEEWNAFVNLLGFTLETGGGEETLVPLAHKVNALQERLRGEQIDLSSYEEGQRYAMNLHSAPEGS